MSKLWFRSNKTNKVYEVVALDKEKGTIRLKGSFGEFDDTYDKALFKKLGYDLVKAETKDAASTATAL